MDDEQYNAWSENAMLARMEYLDGKLTAEEFLQRIDTTHELESYEVSKAVPITESVWQKKVAADFRFDPESRYPETLMRLNLGKPNAGWEILTADDQRRRDQQGHQPLRYKIGTAYRQAAGSLHKRPAAFSLFTAA